MAKTEDTAPVLAPPPVLFTLAAIAGLGFDWLVPLPLLEWVSAGPRFALGSIVAVAAVGLGIWGIAAFLRAGTPAEPWHPTTALVTTGLYARIRNPMYVGLVGLLLAAALASAGEGLLIAAVVLALALHHGVVLPEERYLERRFGAAYRSYRDRVPRYGLPL